MMGLLDMRHGRGAGRERHGSVPCRPAVLNSLLPHVGGHCMERDRPRCLLSHSPRVSLSNGSQASALQLAPPVL